MLSYRVSSRRAELLRQGRKEAKSKAAEQERLQEWKKAEAKRKIDEQGEKAERYRRALRLLKPLS